MTMESRILSVIILIALGIAGGIGGTQALLVTLGGVFSAITIILMMRSRNNTSLVPRTETREEVQDGSMNILDGYWPIIGWALVLRFLIVIVVNETPLWLAFGPDAKTWERYGILIALSWSQSEWNANAVFSDVGENSFFPMINAMVYYVFGSSRYPMSFLNTIMGVVVAYAAAVFAYQTYDIKAARRTFLLVLFYPSLMLWSSMNLREVWAHGAILLVLITGQNVRGKMAPASFALLLGALIVLYYIRPYLPGLILIAVVGSMFVVRAQELPHALCALGGVLIFIDLYGESYGLVSNLGFEDKLETIQVMREGLSFGGSAYGEGAETRTLYGVLRYLPYGVAQFLFAPFPWSARTSLQLIALPESLAFIYLTYQGLTQLSEDVRRRFSRVVLPLLTIVVFTCAYGLVSGNEGTAFRHRAQVIIIMLVFSAAAQTRSRDRLFQSSSEHSRLRSLTLKPTFENK